jgi:hypothetical protein
VDVKSQTHESSFFFASCVLRPKRDLLLSVARRPAVTLTWNAPSKAQGPGISVARNEPSGVFVSRFCVSSSRFLVRCLLLGQRSRMNFLSHHIGPLFHQHRSNPSAELARHRHDGDPRTHMPRVPAANRAVKIRSSPSWRIADQAPWMSLLRNRLWPVRVIEPRSVFSPLESSQWEPLPKTLRAWRTFLSSRQSPIRARSWLATIQPMPQTLIMYFMHCASSGSF